MTSARNRRVRPTAGRHSSRRHAAGVVVRSVSCANVLHGPRFRTFLMLSRAQRCWAVTIRLVGGMSATGSTTPTLRHAAETSRVVKLSNHSPGERAPLPARGRPSADPRPGGGSLPLQRGQAKRVAGAAPAALNAPCRSTSTSGPRSRTSLTRNTRVSTSAASTMRCAAGRSTWSASVGASGPRATARRRREPTRRRRVRPTAPHGPSRRLSAFPRCRPAQGNLSRAQPPRRKTTMPMALRPGAVSSSRSITAYPAPASRATRRAMAGSRVP